MTQETISQKPPKTFATPFADSGDRNAIPDTGVDAVNIQQGFPSIFSTPRANSGKSVARRDMNGILNSLSSLNYYFQYMGRNPWVSGTSYPKGAKVWYDNAEWISPFDNNTTAPGGQNEDGDDAWIAINDLGGTVGGSGDDAVDFSGLWSAIAALSASVHGDSGSGNYDYIITMPSKTSGLTSDGSGYMVSPLVDNETDFTTGDFEIHWKVTLYVAYTGTTRRPPTTLYAFPRLKFTSAKNGSNSYVSKDGPRLCLNILDGCWYVGHVAQHDYYQQYGVELTRQPEATLKQYTECATIWSGLKWNSSSSYSAYSKARKPAGSYVSFVFDDNWTTTKVPSGGTILYESTNDNVGFAFVQRSRHVQTTYDDGTTESSMTLGLKYHEVVYRNTTTGKSHRVTFASDGVSNIKFLVDGIEKSSLPVGQQFQLSPVI